MRGEDEPLLPTIARRPLRMVLGTEYFILRRRREWAASSGTRFARRVARELEWEQFRHSTPLLRKLKDVDMYLQHNKVTNLRLAVKRVDGVTLNPGETLSYWRLIGRPSKRKGYVPGMVLINGTVGVGIGGGLCQLSNLIYWMTSHTPLTVTERHRHGYDVFPDAERTVPFGSGATCFFNYGDLVIRNDTDRPYQLRVAVTDDELVGRWMSNHPPVATYEVYEKEHLIRSETWGGYTRHNLLHRTRRSLDGAEVTDEYVTENHAIMMYPPLLARAPSATPPRFRHTQRCGGIDGGAASTRS